MSETRILSHVLAALLLAANCASAQTAAASPAELRCEYRSDPEGIDVAKPRLSWVLTPANPDARGVRQTAYHVLVATSEEQLAAGKGDLWDTGKVASDQSIQIIYDGKPLAPGKPAFWKVQLWDQAGKASSWSPTARWSMGLLKTSDWKAKWIGVEEKTLFRSRTSPFWSLRNAQWIWTAEPSGNRFFRTKFITPSGRQVKRAVLILGAADEYEAFVNGVRQGKGTFVRMPDTLDITAQVHSGANTVAVAAKGAKTNAALIAAVRLEFTSGEPMLFQSNQSWKTANEATGDWKTEQFDDAAWKPAKQLGAYGVKPWGEAGFDEERVLPARMLRKEFTAKPGLKRATAFISGQGSSELYLNGARVSDHVLSPGLTDYDKRTLYVTHDVTKQLKSGPNAIGVMLGNGRYYGPRETIPIGMRTFGTPRLLLQLQLEYVDGTVETVVSDESWQASTKGPIRANSEYDGEEYDARLEMPGWNATGFKAEGWEPAQIVSAPKGVLSAQMAEPMRVVESVKPLSVSQISPGRFVFDMGQNMVGWVRLKVSGPAGTRVLLRHSESALPDGRLYLDNLRSARATDSYTLKGNGAEVYEPRFTYHGFRYVEVTGYPGQPKEDAIEGRVVQDAMTRAGAWTSSDAMLNKLHKNIFWGVRGNYRSIPTDCPQRDERQGWLGDRSVVSRSESYLYDIAAFYTKWEPTSPMRRRPRAASPTSRRRSGLSTPTT